jgi:hypothetical protein
VQVHLALPSVMFQYVIGDSDFERVDVINDLGVLVSKSARMLGFLKRI